MKIPLLKGSSSNDEHEVPLRKGLSPYEKGKTPLCKESSLKEVKSL